MKAIEKILNNNIITSSIFTVLILLILSVVVGFFISFQSSFKIIFSLFYVLFLPGILVSFVLLPYEKKQISLLERVILSFALSISIVPLTVFYTNIFGVGMSFSNVLLVTLIICFASAIIIFVRSFIGKKKGGTNEINN